jgi:peptide/nickel transport system substrate-binding protein
MGAYDSTPHRGVKKLLSRPGQGSLRLLSLVIATIFAIYLTAGCRLAGKARQLDDSSTLYIGHVGTSFPTSYMPWQSREGIAPTIASMIYSTLFSYDSTTGLYNPLIAEHWCYTDKEGNPLLTEDGAIDYAKVAGTYAKEKDMSASNKRKYMVVRIKLKDDVTWSDGMPFTVADVVYSYDLCANYEKSGHAGATVWVSDLKHRYQDGELTAQGIFTYDDNPLGYPIAESEKDTVLYLHVDTVLGSVASLFSTVLILPKHIWEPIVTEECPINTTEPSAKQIEARSFPVGCGAYKLNAQETSAQVIVLERRDDYHLKKEDGSPLFSIERLKFLLYQEENVAIFSLLKGYIDVLDNTINPNYASLFAARDDITLLSTENAFVNTLVLNVNPTEDQRTPLRDLLGNKNFRRALSLAIDQEELIKNVLNGYGSTFSQGLVSPASKIYNDQVKPVTGSYVERIEEANSLLDQIVPERDEEGYRTLHGERILYEILAGPAQQDTVSFLETQFQRIGIAVRYTAAGSTPERTFLFRSKFDMTLQGVTLDLSNVDLMYNAHFVNLGDSSNYGRLENDELKKTITAMRYTLDLSDKYALLADLQTAVAEEYYKLPLYSANVLSVARNDRFTGWVAGFSQSAFNSDSLKQLVPAKGTQS